MQHFFRLELSAALLLFPMRVLRAQDLAPRARNVTYIQFGGNYQSISVAWQLPFLGRPN
jgi:hypothetical protein